MKLEEISEILRQLFVPFQLFFVKILLPNFFLQNLYFGVVLEKKINVIIFQREIPPPLFLFKSIFCRSRKYLRFLWRRQLSKRRIIAVSSAYKFKNSSVVGRLFQFVISFSNSEIGERNVVQSFRFVSRKFIVISCGFCTNL